MLIPHSMAKHFRRGNLQDHIKILLSDGKPAFPMDLLRNGNKRKRVKMARVAVVGVGAIGGALAGFLETAGGHQIT